MIIERLKSNVHNGKPCQCAYENYNLDAIGHFGRGCEYLKPSPSSLGMGQSQCSSGVTFQAEGKDIVDIITNIAEFVHYGRAMYSTEVLRFGGNYLGFLSLVLCQCSIDG